MFFLSNKSGEKWAIAFIIFTIVAPIAIPLIALICF